MKFFGIIAAAIVLIATNSSFADSLVYDNGSFITGGGGCDFSGNVTSTSSPASPNTTLGSQSSYLIKRRIDDFTVPPGQSWSLTTLHWRLYQPGTLYDAGIPDARVRIWATNPGPSSEPLWGDLDTNRALNTVFLGAYRTSQGDLSNCNRAIKDVEINLAGLPVLPSGTYWVEVGFHTTTSGGLFSPPTEPRKPGDNALSTDYSGVVQPDVDDGSGQDMEYPFQLYGTVGAPVTHACVLPNGTCTNATLQDCQQIFHGTYSYFYNCSQLGACCNHANGICVSNTQPSDCTGSGMQFSAGITCASVLNCGLINGACCFPTDVPVDCQAFTRGINCAAAGGHWHVGNCTSVSCNDFCETADEIFDGDTLMDNFGYGTEHDLTPNACNNNPFIGMKDAWFRYTSTIGASGGYVTFSMCQNTTFQSTIQVYKLDEGTTCDDLNGTAAAMYCNIGGCNISGGPALLNIQTNPGDKFLIRIGGYNGAEGGGMLRISTIEVGEGACCQLNGTCTVMLQSECLAGPNSFTPFVNCDQAETTCGPIGACCRGADGCQVTFQGVCVALGGTYLGEGSSCGSPDDCDGDGETNVCALVAGATDCNSNGIPDSCDIGPSGSSTDCDGNNIPDECQPSIYCCRGDTNADGRIDGLDIAPFVQALTSGTPNCFTSAFCRVDMNQDYQLSDADIAAFVTAVLEGSVCPVLIHGTGILDAPLPGSPYRRKGFMFDESGNLLKIYDAVPGAQNDAFGYRDGTSDGTYIYFGWTTGVARHDADGSNGVQIIFGPTPGTAVTWRGLAYDPTGDNGNGSFWTQSFTSDLVECTLTGVLLHQFSNDLLIYGLAYDYSTGMLWGHAVDENSSAIIVEINPETGQPTGVSYPSHFNLPGPSTVGLATHGGLEMDPVTHALFGVLQATNDTFFSMTTTGALTGPLSPNPRTDITAQTGSNANVGITIIRP